MGSLAVSLLFLFTFACASLQSNYEEAQKTIEDAKNDAINRLKASLVGADDSVFKQPLRDLDQVTKAGSSDVELIKNFQGPGEKAEVLAASAKFWKEKIQLIVKPYLENPGVYKGLVIHDESPLPDPESNGSETQKLKEREIDEKVSAAIESLRREHERLTSAKPLTLHDITRSNWRRLALDTALEAAEDSIRRQGQRSKGDVAKGQVEKGDQWLSRVILTASATFRANVNDIEANL